MVKSFSSQLDSSQNIFPGSLGVARNRNIFFQSSSPLGPIESCSFFPWLSLLVFHRKNDDSRKRDKSAKRRCAETRVRTRQLRPRDVPHSSQEREILIALVRDRRRRSNARGERRERNNDNENPIKFSMKVPGGERGDVWSCGSVADEKKKKNRAGYDNDWRDLARAKGRSGE